jgi:hypothetical protein
LTDKGKGIEVMAASMDERRRARLAHIEAEQAHGEELLKRYGREQTRQARAVVGYAAAKRKRRR